MSVVQEEVWAGQRDSVTLIISNQANVPNRFVHDECLAQYSLEYAFKLIADDYEAAKAYAHWFPSSG